MIDCPVVTLHTEMLEDKLGPLLDKHMVKVFEVKLVKSRFFDLESNFRFVIMFRQFDNKLRKFLSESRWECLGNDC